MTRQEKLIVVLGILFISFNLRAPITAVGSIVDMIQSDYALSSASAGFITTLPLIAFAVVSPFVSKLSNKYGHASTMMTGLIFILVGILCRSYLGLYGLFIGTAIIGVGIAIGNVIIPAIIKKHFSKRVGLVTSIYTSGMCIFAAVGAGVSVPLATGVDVGWKNSLAVWFVLAIVTIFIWSTQTRGERAAKKANQEFEANQAKAGQAAISADGQRSKITRTSGAATTYTTEKSTSVWKSSLAWWVTLFMGTQSLIFYSLVAWLPTIITSKGLTVGFASSMALMFQLMAIPATLVIPIISDKLKNQKMLVLVVCMIYAIGMFLFLTGSTQAVLVAAILLMAIGMGGSISLSIAFISLRSPNSQKASELSGMAQSAGYLFAAAGPLVTGFIFDLKSSWTVPLVLFIALIGLLAFCGLFAGSDHTVQE